MLIDIPLWRLSPVWLKESLGRSEEDLRVLTTEQAAEIFLKMIYPLANLQGSEAKELLLALVLKIKTGPLIHFFNAMVEDNVDYVKQALKDRATNRTALLLTASVCGALKVVQFLFHSMIDLETCDDAGWTALSSAVLFGHANIVSELIKDGVDVNRVTAQSVTPLMLAAARGHNDIVRALIDNGANVNATDSEGWTALIYSREEGRSLVAPTLIAAGATE